MKKTSILLVFLAAILFAPLFTQGGRPSPITAQKEVVALDMPTTTPQTLPVIAAEMPVADTEAKPEAHHPVRLIIPSINLDIPIQQEGINEQGEMDVPSGETNNAGWYQYGTIPGETGSAVLAAHVFAAFANLENISPGSDIYVITEQGSKVHFVVSEKKLYPLAELSGETLFNRSDTARLNLITCAGKFIPEDGTYDHRLVVFAILVDNGI